ncbi:MAG: hypothetical protein HN344_07320 [Gammaproteobacteria bacterium]|nr:hypothetical protein [Gammaproteobacteria bacterium]
MNFPIELLLSPIALIGIWLYWRKHQLHRKNTMTQEKRGLLADEPFNELLSIEGKSLIEKEKEKERESCRLSSNARPTLRSWE